MRFKHFSLSFALLNIGEIRARCNFRFFIMSSMHCWCIENSSVKQAIWKWKKISIIFLISCCFWGSQFDFSFSVSRALFFMQHKTHLNIFVVLLSFKLWDSYAMLRIVLLRFCFLYLEFKYFIRMHQTPMPKLLLLKLISLDRLQTLAVEESRSRMKMAS